ncbi:hypothetical protein Hdeb2414_s0015g00440131 [Helianthus debilis subsp. tardiflorus]
MLLMELFVLMCIGKYVLATSGPHLSYKWYRTMEGKYFLYPTVMARLEQWTFGLYPACIKYLMSGFDLPEFRISLIFRYLTFSRILL